MPSSCAKQRKPVIGLAGGIGAGKTSVARIFESLGAAVIDFDRLAHEELQNPQVAACLQRWWGPSIRRPDGTVDRRAVASIVFRSPGELARLEKLLYPRLGRRCKKMLADLASAPGITAIVLDAPKLFEAGLNRLCDAVVFVAADEALRVQRVAQSRGWTQEELKERENLQNPLDTKKAGADHIVENRSSIEELRRQVERVFSSVLASCA